VRKVGETEKRTKAGGVLSAACQLHNFQIRFILRYHWDGLMEEGLQCGAARSVIPEELQEAFLAEPEDTKDIGDGLGSERVPVGYL
jgi:hypothetical protein